MHKSMQADSLSLDEASGIDFWGWYIYILLFFILLYFFLFRLLLQVVDMDFDHRETGSHDGVYALQPAGKTRDLDWSADHRFDILFLFLHFFLNVPVCRYWHGFVNTSMPTARGTGCCALDFCFAQGSVSGTVADLLQRDVEAAAFCRVGLMKSLQRRFCILLSHLLFFTTWDDSHGISEQHSRARNNAVYKHELLWISI